MSKIIRRSVLAIFSGKFDIPSHMIRMALVEKGVAYDLLCPDNIDDLNKELSRDEIIDEMLSINPSGEYPTVVDRDLVLVDTRIILEYLDERFPHPSLYPIYPDIRAKIRMVLKQIEQIMFPRIKDLTHLDSGVVNRCTYDMLNFLSSIDALIEDDTKYLMGEEFSILDCYIVPLIYRLVRINPLNRQRFSLKLQEYQQRMFSREQFEVSLTLKSSKGFLEKDK